MQLNFIFTELTTRILHQNVKMSEQRLKNTIVLISRTSYPLLGNLFKLTSTKVKKVLSFPLYFASVTSLHYEKNSIDFAPGAP